MVTNQDWHLHNVRVTSDYQVDFNLKKGQICPVHLSDRYLKPKKKELPIYSINTVALVR